MLRFDKGQRERLVGCAVRQVKNGENACAPIIMSVAVVELWDAIYVATSPHNFYWIMSVSIESA